jgi:hypothetical protein
MAMANGNGNCRRRLCRKRRTGLSRRVPSRSPPGHGKRRAPVPHFSLPPLQHHQDSLPPPPPAWTRPQPATACRRRLVASGSSRATTSSASPQPPDGDRPPPVELAAAAASHSWPVVGWLPMQRHAGGCGSVFGNSRHCWVWFCGTTEDAVISRCCCVLSHSLPPPTPVCNMNLSPSRARDSSIFVRFDGHRMGS